MRKPRVKKKLPHTRWQPGMLRFAFICSPYKGNVEANERRAIELAQKALDMDYMPLVPHLHFPKFLDDNDTKQREMGIRAGLFFLEACTLMIIDTRTGISDGMLREFQFSIDKRKTKLFVCHNCGKLTKDRETTQNSAERGAFYRPVFSCSRKCSAQWRREHSKRKMVDVVCSDCGTRFKKEWNQYQLYSRLHFCNQSCMVAYQKKNSIQAWLINPEEYCGWTHRRQQRAHYNRKLRNELGKPLGED